MSTATHAAEEKPGTPGAPTHAEISTQLRLVLASPIFHGSKRCQQFIEYVCEKALNGETGALKERFIAIEVFGRHPETAGHGEDTIVRVGAREVRKRLAQYYMTPEGSASTILIELPPGSYSPEFSYTASAKQLSMLRVEMPARGIPDEPSVAPELSIGPELSIPREPPIKEVAPVPATGWPRGLVIAIAIVILGIAAVAGTLATSAKWTLSDTRADAFQRFWAPVFRSSEPLLIGVGHPLVYQPSHRATMLNMQRLPPTPFPIQQPLDLPPGELNGGDFVPVLNQYVGFGDMVAANEVSQMLAHHARNVRLMMASSIPFAELRQSQTYLIGSVSNRWTMELGQNWRFRFTWSAADHQPEFIDTLGSSPREWKIASHDDGSALEDYSLICRIRSSPTGMLLIVSAGIKQFGTEAGGRILADPVALSTILNKLPPGWEDKNLQILLHMKVIGNTPAQPEVVASHVW